MGVKLERVTVIGAGIGGLCAAIGLRRLGYSVDVYERTPAFGEVGAGITLWANAIRGLGILGIPEEALGGTRIRLAEITDWRGRPFTSTRMNELESRLGGHSLSLHRADLHRELQAALPENTLHTNATCIGFEQDSDGVTGCFDDGSRVHSDLLIGADGIHSVIRKQMIPTMHLRYAGYIGWRGVVDNPGSAALDRTTEIWGCGARFGVVPIGGDRIYWFGTANFREGLKPTPAERKAMLLKDFRGWRAPVEDLIAATPEDQILYNDIYDFPPLAHWSTERVTLLGDAAHATTPNLGQGACQAIESSVVLARCMEKETDLSMALQRYERERRPRTTWITNQSRLLGQVGQIENPLLCALRDFVMRATPSSAMKSQIIKSAGAKI